MKRTLIALAIILIAAFAYFAFPSPDSMKLVLVGNESGGTAARDKHMLALMEARLQRFADTHHMKVEISYLDASLPPAKLEAQIQSLVDDGLADVLLGCGDSSCVRRVLPLAESHGINLVYPGSSEGLFKSRYLIHLGVVANQYLFPAVSWIRQHLGENIFYLGSESARSRMMGRMLSNQLLKASSQALVGEEYLDAFEELPSILDKISVYQPDVVLLDTCEWLWHPTFVQALRDIKQRKFSLCTDQRMPNVNDLYFVSHYYDHKRNRLNKELHETINGPPDALISMAILATDMYIDGWQKHRTNHAGKIADYFKGKNAFTATGSMAVDFHNEGSWHSVFIVRADPGDDKLLWISDVLMRPVMFPGLEAPSDWQHNLTIYWRNNRGRWRTGSMNGKPWL